MAARRFATSLVVAFGLAAAACAPSDRPVRAATPVPSITATVRDQSESMLDVVQTPNGDDYGFVVEDLTTGSRSAFNADRVFASGSVYKLPVAWEVLRQVDAKHLQLASTIEILDEDAEEVEPYGGFAPGDTPTVQEALQVMLSVSSNAAAHAFLRVLGRHEFNQAMDDLGLRQTRVPEPSDDGEQQPTEAVSSAQDISTLLRLFATHQGLSESSLDVLQSLLSHSAPPDALRDTMADDVSVLEKTGNLADASNVGALLLTQRAQVILVVFDEDVDPGDARAVITQLGQAAYEQYLRAP